MHVCQAVNCHLHFWQNDRDVLRATAVTRWWNGYQNKSQHRKLTLEKKVFPPLQWRLEPGTFLQWIQCSNRWAIPLPMSVFCFFCSSPLCLSKQSVVLLELLLFYVLLCVCLYVCVRVRITVQSGCLAVRNCHCHWSVFQLRDAVALCEFMLWLENEVRSFEQLMSHDLVRLGSRLQSVKVKISDDQKAVWKLFFFFFF